MVFLIIKKDNNLEVVSPETYGINTWGMSTQESIEKRKDGWYSTYWSDGGQWLDDINEEYKLDVVLETRSWEEVIEYLIENNSKIDRKTVASMNKIIDDYLDYWH